MIKNILIALVLVIGLQLITDVFPVNDLPVVYAQDGALDSPSFMFDLGAVTHEGIESSTRGGWIRRGVNYFLEKIIGFMATVIGSLAVLTMSWGGFMMLSSGGGDAPRYEKGKQLVKYSLIGLGVTLLAYIMVTLVQLLIVSIYD
ncbi:hypothetical protein JXD20_04180 [Candidatus Peregrinibacteria bacterium]|nr:hypothetical protein [Candidatus Peregrinibacteria bacterium]